MTALPVSYLFVPADRPERCTRALASGADAVIVDLEDAVAPAAKAAARQALAAWLDSLPPPHRVHLRINAAGTPHFDEDLRLCAHPAVDAVVLPKAETPEALAAVAARAPGRALLPLVETARGLEAAQALGAAPAVQRLVFGSIDFQADLGIEGDDDALLFFRSQLVLASRLAGCAAPVDGVSTALDDAQAVARDAARARRLGFGGKLAIHPRQLAALHEAFEPDAAQRAWAQRVLAAAESSGGAAVAVDGAMVDAPVIARARALLARVRLPSVEN